MTWGISSHDALMFARDRPAEAAERLARDLAELREVGQRPPFAFGSRRLGRHRGELTCVPLHVVLGDASARSGTTDRGEIDADLTRELAYARRGEERAIRRGRRRARAAAVLVPTSRRAVWAPVQRVRAQVVVERRLPARGLAPRLAPGQPAPPAPPAPAASTDPNRAARVRPGASLRGRAVEWRGHQLGSGPFRVLRPHSPTAIGT